MFLNYKYVGWCPLADTNFCIANGCGVFEDYAVDNILRALRISFLMVKDKFRAFSTLPITCYVLPTLFSIKNFFHKGIPPHKLYLPHDALSGIDSIFAISGLVSGRYILTSVPCPSRPSILMLP